MAAPRWSDKSTKRRAARVAQFDTILGSVARGLAHHADADYVSVAQVDDAYAAIARCQLTRVPWYRSSECATSAGALMMGLAISLANLLARIAPDSTPLQIVGGGGLFLFGAIIWLNGWQRRQRLPEIPRQRSRWFTCWPVFQCPRIDEL
jgi:hypothetical protein